MYEILSKLLFLITEANLSHKGLLIKNQDPQELKINDLDLIYQINQI
jgi:hypothetical protein